MNYSFYDIVVKYDTITTDQLLSKDYLVPLEAQSPQKKKENPMAYAQSTAAITVTPAPVDEAKKYLLNRLENLFWEKDRELDKLYSPPTPKSAKEALKWLQDGNFHVSKSFMKRMDADIDEDDDSYSDHHAFMSYEFMNYGVQWGKTEPDYKARIASYDKLKAAHQKAKDEISVLTDETARLEALR